MEDEVKATKVTWPSVITWDKSSGTLLLDFGTTFKINSGAESGSDYNYSDHEISPAPKIQMVVLDIC